MMCDNFEISGTGAALLDFNDLLCVLVNDDNVEGFDTKWDTVLLSMSKFPEEDIFAEKLPDIAP